MVKKMKPAIRQHVKTRCQGCKQEFDPWKEGIIETLPRGWTHVSCPRCHHLYCITGGSSTTTPSEKEKKVEKQDTRQPSLLDFKKK